MTPDWYYNAYELAVDNYDGEEYGGREWEELSDEEQQELIEDYYPY
jgi:hypothetical protein